jgi:hypothetical protein
MEKKTGVLFDKCVIVKECICSYPKPANKLFEYLREHRVGLTTDEILKASEYLINKESSKISRSRHESSMGIFYHTIKPRLKVENIPPSRCEEKMRRLRGIFNKMFKESGNLPPSLVPSSLRDTVTEIYAEQARKNSGPYSLSDKIFSTPILDEDIRIIGCAALMREEYPSMYLVSYDHHIIDTVVATTVKSEFDVTCGNPNYVLQMLKEDLFKGKTISNTCG